MRAVNSQIRYDRSPKLSVVSTCYRAEPAPEQAMVHDQQVNVLSNRKLDRRFTRIHRGPDLRHPPVVFQLQAIECIRVILDFLDLQEMVEKIANRIEHRWKNTDCSSASGFFSGVIRIAVSDPPSDQGARYFFIGVQYRNLFYAFDPSCNSAQLRKDPR